MAMFRREALERAGGFDPSVNAAADYALYLRVARSHPLYNHARVVAYHRRHAENMSSNAGRLLQESLHGTQARAALRGARRGAAGGVLEGLEDVAGLLRNQARQ